MCLDNQGNLPLHLCLMHNHGDATYEIVCMLLATYPSAARTPLGKTRAFATLWQEYPAELVLRNTSCHAAKITTLILNTYPDVLGFVDRLGASLLHRCVCVVYVCVCVCMYVCIPGFVDRLGASLLHRCVCVVCVCVCMYLGLWIGWVLVAT